MTRYRHLILAVLVLLCAGQSKAWNCPTGQHNVQVPDGTTSGTIHVIEGETFQCQPDVPPSTPGNTTATASANANSSSNSSSKATGGNGFASASGGNANQQQGQQQTANGGAGGSAAASNGDQSNDISYANSSTYNAKVAAASAIAPDNFSTAPCTKSASASVQTIPFGIGGGFSTIDKGCDDRETAKYFLMLRNRVAAATILCDTPAAKRAHLKLETCLLSVPEVAPVIIAAPAPRVEAKQPINVNVTVQAPAAPSVAVAAVAIAKVEAPKPAGSCVVLGRVDNVCARVLNDNVERLLADGGARLVVTGKQASILAVRDYVTKGKHGVWIDSARILLNVNDEPSATVVFGIIQGTQPTVQ